MMEFCKIKNMVVNGTIEGHLMQAVKPFVGSLTLPASGPKHYDETFEVEDVIEGNGIDTCAAPLAGWKNINIGSRKDGEVGERRKLSCTTSCPPSHERSKIAGPWSLEWLRDIDHGDAGVIFASRKKLKKKSSINQEQQVKHKDATKKIEGVLRHPGGV